jgi:hypothetical protein
METALLYHGTQNFGAGEVQEEKMRRFASCVVLSIFLMGALKVAARDGDDKATPSPRAGDTPSAKSANSDKPAAKGSEKDFVQTELHDLRNLVEAQSEELRDLRSRLAAVEAERAASKGVSAPAAAPPVEAVQPATPAPTPDRSMPVAAAPVGAKLQGEGSEQKEPKSPLFFRIGSAEFSPGGFLDFAAYYRTTNDGAGIATGFGAIPYNNQLPQGRLSETHFSAQYSRLSLKVDAPLPKSTKLTAYVESDFLGFQPANAYITANSDSLRLRVYWADVKHGKWEVLGGQAWSLITPNRVGLSPMTSDIFYTLNEDPNFQVGLIWARQPQFRVVYHPSEHWAVGLSLENPQQFAPGSVVYPSPFFTTQFDNGSGVTNAASSSTNTAVPNLHPDIIVKAAYDAHPAGHSFHAEAAGLVRSFKVFNDLATPASTNTITGGGGSINLNYEVIHNLRLIANSFYSDGGGRYNIGLGPDAIVKPNGTLSAVHSGSGLGGFEYQALPNYMFYGYYGAAYFERNFGLLPETPASSCAGLVSFTCVGFGFPGSANTSNRAVQEATIGIIPTLWSNENYGKVQIITQYSYLTRSPWSTLPIPPATTPTPKNAHASMVYLDVRYTLP